MNEETGLIVQNVITRAHTTLADKFVGKVVEKLSGPFKVKKYAVESDYFQTEVLELELDEKTTLKLSMLVRE